MIAPAWTDSLWLEGEVLLRHVYWRCPAIRQWAKRIAAKRQPPPPLVERTALQDFLREIGVVEGALVMAHTSVSQFRLKSENRVPASGGSFLTSAKLLVDDLMDLLGPTGTLVMPSNAHYQFEDGMCTPEERLRRVIEYDPRRTPCAVGMANELFWRRKDVLRSLHPYNSLAARGPLAEELLADNLNARKPLPHGVDSGYYRLCRRQGLVIGIGASLRKYMTLVHVPEDVRDEDWPVPNFFEERRYRICVGGHYDMCMVRQRRAEFGLFCTLRKVFVDLVREGILRRGVVEGLTIDWVSAGEVFDYMMRKNRGSYYPYYGIKLMKT